MTLEVDDSGAYLNIKVDGRLRVSVSEEHDEVLVYENEVDEPTRFTLERGELLDL